jgi:hypothetical protein
MADGNYDSTNSGVIFGPHQDQTLSGQGKVNIEGGESKYVIVREKLSRDGDPQLVLYQRAGVLFHNDKKGNDKAPDFSGPLDMHPNHKIAAWTGEKDGRKYMSLKVSLKQSNGNGGGQQQQQQNAGWGAGAGMDDEIPF